MACSQVLLDSEEMPTLSYMELDPSEDTGVISSFESMGLREELLRGINACGLGNQPTLMQQRSVVCIGSGRDVIAQAHSGADKTATFAISLLQSLDTTLRETQVLVLTPTCESATNIQKVVLALGGNMDVKCHACIGGTRRGDEKRNMNSGQHVVCGRASRIYDMIRKRVLSTRSTKLVIIEEAEEMCNKGYKENILDIFRYLPHNTQVVMYTKNALHTENSEIAELSVNLMKNPIKTWVSRDKLNMDFVAVEPEEGQLLLYSEDCVFSITPL